MSNGLESPTCWGLLRHTLNKVQPAVAWESNTLTLRNPKEPYSINSAPFVAVQT